MAKAEFRNALMWKEDYETLSEDAEALGRLMRKEGKCAKWEALAMLVRDMREAGVFERYAAVARCD